MLSQEVPLGALAVRITSVEDLTLFPTIKACHSIIRVARAYGVSVHVWVSSACTAGCSWRFVNDSLGITTGDEDMTNRLIAAAIGICGHASRTGETFSWEWPKDNSLE